MSADYILKNHIGKSGSITWRSPSNIALVKYWGKFGRQLPKNPSLSFTLTNAYSETKLNYKVLETPQDKIELYFEFEGKEMEAFANKILKFLSSILDIYPFLNQLSFSISSNNSFPHSSGIASSASAMSALALCLVSMEKEIFETSMQNEEFLKKASTIARLGSGSASRSVYPLIGLWGESKTILSSSNEYAIPYSEGIDSVFLNFHDDILIVSEKEKSVSSTAGHALMNNNIYSENRYQQANTRIEELIVAMQSGDVSSFGKIAEDEALTLHALMMCSDPSYILMEPETLQIINKVRAFRKETNLDVYFTLDAGPNIHLLYPDQIKAEIKEFVKTELKQHCVKILEDQVGSGPIQIS